MLMKKFFKIITIVLVMALCLFTPGVPMTVNAMVNLVPTEDTSYHFTAPTQDQNLFTSTTTVQDLSTWTKPSSNRLVAQQLNNSNNSSFNQAHPDNSLTNLQERQPYVIATDIPNAPANGGYTASEISLQANGYYKISVEYCVVEQKNNTTSKNHAFGTFYLNDNNKIDLLPQNNVWKTATFYVQTDKLETATITPELYFGSHEENALGAIYFDNFNVTALRESTFVAETGEIDSLRIINFTKQDAQTLIKSFNNTDFTPSKTTANADSKNAITTSMLPTSLNLQNFNHQFYAKDDTISDVMLLKAYNANASLTLDNYTFKPRPHEVYMFQFYSIASAASDFGGFYFMIEDTAEQIVNLTDYPYHNGWQLNTVFFVAGHELGQEYQLSFTLSNSSNTTGWACIDEFKIYQVSGNYAVDNASAVGVHDTYDQNASDETLMMPNGYFELGTATDLNNNSYPYPLVADNWTTNVTTNGIINLHHTLWDASFADETIGHPGYPHNSTENNQVYMMHNTTTTYNLLTSPALSITAGTTNYLSFDAYGQNTAKVRAYILTSETDDDGNLTNEVVLNNILPINDGTWHHYEFSIIDNEFNATRNYYLRFEMADKGYAYIDNVCLTTDRVTNTEGTTTENVDLGQQWLIKNLWQATTEFNQPTCETALNSISFNNENLGGQKTTVEYNFAYNLTNTEDKCYEVIIEASGKNAYLGFSNYNGLLEVTNDTDHLNQVNQYKLYLEPSDNTTAVNLQITLGHVSNDDDDEITIANGEILINNITINAITQDEYNLAKNQANKNHRMKILSLSDTTDTDDGETTDTTTDNNFFGENWWYLIPTLITAFALLLALTAFLFRKIKFDKHITKKTTSYARDMRLKNQQNKIVAQKAVKVDNVIDESQNN